MLVVLTVHLYTFRVLKGGEREFKITRVQKQFLVTASLYLDFFHLS